MERNTMEQPAPGIRGPDRIEFSLPWPPSVNHYYRPFTGRDGTQGIVTRGGREYRNRAIYRILEQRVPRRKLAGSLEILLVAFPPDGFRRRDLDNLLKPALDALTHADVIADDSHIDVLIVQRGPAQPPDGSLRVTVTDRRTESVNG